MVNAAAQCQHREKHEPERPHVIFHSVLDPMVRLRVVTVAATAAAIAVAVAGFGGAIGFGAAGAFAVVVHARHAEINDVQLRAFDQRVSRFDVAVHDVVRVQMHERFRHLLAQRHYGCAGGASVAMPRVQGPRMLHHGLNAVRNVVEGRARRRGHVFNAAKLHMHGNDDVVRVIHADVFQAQARHHVVFRAYLRIVKRGFHPHHEISHVKHADYFSHGVEHGAHRDAIVRVNVARVNHEARPPPNLFNYFFHVVHVKPVCPQTPFVGF